MASKALLGGSIAGIGTLTALIGVLASGTPIMPVDMSLEADLAQPPNDAQRCLESAEGLAAWWNHATATNKLPAVAVQKAGDGDVFVFSVDGEPRETWTLQEASPGRVAYTVTYGKMAIDRSFELEEGSVTWNEEGRLPVLAWFKLLGEDPGVEGFMETAEALGTASCP